jgi:hypothetical protein
MTRRVFLLLAAPTFAAAQNQPFVPEDFHVPMSHQTSTYKLVPLGPKYARQDFDAYMGSIEHLQKTFTFSTRWPHAGLTMADAVKDVEGEQERFQSRRSFTYAVLTIDESKELGCVYISPSPKQGYDAQIRMWVIREQFDKGFEAELLAEVKKWMSASWPFRSIAYLGHGISREEYRALPDKPGLRKK